jgi:hypothetical protein
MKNIFYLSLVIVAPLFSSAQSEKVYSFCEQYIVANDCLTFALEYNGNLDKEHLFLIKVNQAAMNAQNLLP